MAKNISQLTDDGLRILRMARVTKTGVKHSKCWYLRRWWRGHSIYFNLGCHFLAAAKKARQIHLSLTELGLPFEEVRVKFAAARRSPRPWDMLQSEMPWISS